MLRATGWMLVLIPALVLLPGCDLQKIVREIGNLSQKFANDVKTASTKIKRVSKEVNGIKKDLTPKTSGTSTTNNSSSIDGGRDTEPTTSPDATASSWPIDPKKLGKAVEQIDAQIAVIQSLEQLDIPAEQKGGLSFVRDEMQKVRNDLAGLRNLDNAQMKKIKDLETRLAQLENQYQDMISRAKVISSTIDSINEKIASVIGTIKNWTGSLFNGSSSSPSTNNSGTNPPVVTKPSGPSTNEPDKAPQVISEMQKRIQDAAMGLLNYGPAGTENGFPYDCPPRVGCANVVSQALKQAGVFDQLFLGVGGKPNRAEGYPYGVIDELVEEKGWMMIPVSDVPPYQAGDVVAWRTYSDTGDDHIGIIVQNGSGMAAVHNSSNRQRPVLEEDLANFYTPTTVLRKVA
jgi:hypothetical protein